MRPGPFPTSSAVLQATDKLARILGQGSVERGRVQCETLNGLGGLGAGCATVLTLSTEHPTKTEALNPKPIALLRCLLTGGVGNSDQLGEAFEASVALGCVLGQGARDGP